MSATKMEAIISLKPGAEFTLRGDILEWSDKSQTAPTESEISAERTRLDAEYTNNKYQRDRKAAYPSLADQLDMQYWDQVNGTTKWKEAIAKVKSDNPKPS